MTKLFVVGIPRDMDELELTGIFSLHGQVGHVKIITDLESGISKGYAFVTMLDEAGANQAIAQLDAMTIDDRLISVRKADKKDEVNKKEKSEMAPPAPVFIKQSKYVDPEKKKRRRRNSSD